MEKIKNLFELEEVKTCLRCGRKLKTPESKRLGLGKICWEKSQSTSYKKLFEIENCLTKSSSGSNVQQDISGGEENATV